MNVFVCIVLAIGATIPMAAAMKKEELEKKLPQVTAQWFVYKGIAGPDKGDKATAWKEFQISREALGKTKLVYGIVSPVDIKYNVNIIQFYNTIKNEHLSDGKGIALSKPLPSINISDLTVKEPEIRTYAEARAKDIFGVKDMDNVVYAIQGFRGPNVTVIDGKLTVDNNSYQNFVFIMMAQADSL